MCASVDSSQDRSKGSDHIEMTQPTTKVPVGFRFHPTDEELVGYYLPKKVTARKIDLDLIRDLDLYKLEPWDLQGQYKLIAVFFLFLFF